MKRQKIRNQVIEALRNLSGEGPGSKSGHGRAFCYGDWWQPSKATFILLSHHILWDMSSVLDEKRRVVLPKAIAEELGLVVGSTITFRRMKGSVMMKKAGKDEDALRVMMSWNPRRTGKPAAVKESEIKEIWS